MIMARTKAEEVRSHAVSPALIAAPPSSAKADPVKIESSNTENNILIYFNEIFLFSIFSLLISVLELP
jgi:hypothetical protein